MPLSFKIKSVIHEKTDEFIILITTADFLLAKLFFICFVIYSLRFVLFVVSDSFGEIKVHVNLPFCPSSSPVRSPSTRDGGGAPSRSRAPRQGRRRGQRRSSPPPLPRLPLPDLLPRLIPIAGLPCHSCHNTILCDGAPPQHLPHRRPPLHLVPSGRLANHSSTTSPTTRAAANTAATAGDIWSKAHIWGLL